MLKKLVRKIIYPFFLFYYVLKRKSLSKNRSGTPLKKGITAVVSAKNESFTIGFCLQSLVGMVDQVVCIDNGSEDNTLELMKEFKEKFGDRIEVDVLSMPGALLGDCREEGLRLTRYQWHLRWDADMVAKNSGPESFINIRNKALKEKRPVAYQLARTNLYGDLRHTNAEPLDPGEPILIRFGKDIYYKEYGKFDAVKLPFYTKTIKDSSRYYYHINGLKSIENIMYRFYYFTWRQLNNTLPKERLTNNVTDFDTFKRLREKHLFGTNDVNSVKFRYLKQQVTHYVKFDPAIYGDYPDVLKEYMDKGQERFKVIYRDGQPYNRIDHEDIEFNAYEPSEEDKNWDVNEFFKKVEEEDFSYLY